MILILRYKKGLNPVKDINFEAKDLETGVKDARKFCAKHGLLFVSCKPFLIDITSDTGSW